MNGLVDALEMKFSDTDIKYILDSQIIMVDRFPTITGVRDYPCFGRLLKLLQIDLNEPEKIEIASSAIDLSYYLLTMKTDDNNRSLCIKADGILELSVLILKFTDKNDFENSQIGIIFQKLISVLNILCYKNPPALSIITDQTELFIELTKLIDMDFAKIYHGVAISVLQLIVTCIESFPILKIFVMNGALIHVINLVMFFPENEKYAQITSHATLCLAGFAVDTPLYHCGESDDEILSQENFLKHLKNVFISLFTPGLYKHIKEPEDFLSHSHEVFETPVLIWNSITRSELSMYLNDQTSDIRKTGEWKSGYSEVFSFSFKTLRHDVLIGSGENIVDDVYLRLFNEVGCDVLPHGEKKFLLSLLDAIQNACDKLFLEKSEDGKYIIYDFIEVVAVSLTYVISKNLNLLKSCKNELKFLSTLLASKNADTQHAAVVIFKYLADDNNIIGFVASNVLYLHALLNVDRSDFDKNPMIITILDLIAVIIRDIRDNTVAIRLADSGILVTALYIFASSDSYTPEQRKKSALLIGTIANNLIIGTNIRELCVLLLDAEFDVRVLGANHSPNALLDFFDNDHDTPVIFWNSNCRSDLLVFLKSELSMIIEHQKLLIENLSHSKETPLFG